MDKYLPLIAVFGSLIKELSAPVGQLPLCVDWVNGPERGCKTVSFNP